MFSQITGGFRRSWLALHTLLNSPSTVGGLHTTDIQFVQITMKMSETKDILHSISFCAETLSTSQHTKQSPHNSEACLSFSLTLSWPHNAVISLMAFTAALFQGLVISRPVAHTIYTRRPLGPARLTGGGPIRYFWHFRLWGRDGNGLLGRKPYPS